MNVYASTCTIYKKMVLCWFINKPIKNGLWCLRSNECSCYNTCMKFSFSSLYAFFHHYLYSMITHYTYSHVATHDKCGEMDMDIEIYTHFLDLPRGIMRNSCLMSHCKWSFFFVWCSHMRIYNVNDKNLSCYHIMHVPISFFLAPFLRFFHSLLVLKSFSCSPKKKNHIFLCLFIHT